MNVQPVELQSVELVQLEQPMVQPLVAAHGTVATRSTTLVHVIGHQSDHPSEGWGECVALPEPTYTADWAAGEWQVLHELFVPALLRAGSVTAVEVARLLAPYKGHQPAKAALEMAVLDAELRAAGQSLAAMWGVAGANGIAGTAVDAMAVDVMAVVGLLEGDALLGAVEQCVTAGYRFVKLKIAPGHDVERIRLVQAAFPALNLRVDANGSYSWNDTAHQNALRSLDLLGLTAIEQPCAADSLHCSAQLCAQLQTPVALDESVSSFERAMDIVSLGAADSLVVKWGNVGGPLVAKRIIEECHSRGVPVTVGGMLETALGRAVCLVLAAQPGCCGAPAEVSPDGRWFHDSLATQPVELTTGCIAVPTAVPTGVGIGVGIGVEVAREVLDQFTVCKIKL